jgi:hypothetical protein
MLLSYIYGRMLFLRFSWSLRALHSSGWLNGDRQKTTAWMFGNGCECVVGYPLNVIINYWKHKNKITPYISDRGSTPFVSLIHISNVALYHVRVTFLTSTKRTFIISYSLLLRTFRLSDKMLSHRCKGFFFKVWVDGWKCGLLSDLTSVLAFIFGIKIYVFRTVPLSIIRSFSLYTQQWYISYRFVEIRIPLVCVQWKTPDGGQRNCPKHVYFYSKNKFEKVVHPAFIIGIVGNCRYILGGYSFSKLLKKH